MVEHRERASAVGQAASTMRRASVERPQVASVVRPQVASVVRRAAIVTKGGASR
jgi:hypothetical protein